MESKKWNAPSSAMLLTTKTTFWIFENSKRSFRSFTLLRHHRGHINQSLSFMNAQWCCFLFWFVWRQCDIWQQKNAQCWKLQSSMSATNTTIFSGWDALEMAPSVKTMWSMHGLFPFKKKCHSSTSFENLMQPRSSETMIFLYPRPHLPKCNSLKQKP